MGKEIKTKSEILTALEYYYEKQETATRECLFALKFIILSIDENIVHTRKYQIPFFRYKEFNLGFLWVHRKKILVGFVEDKKTFSQTAIRQKKDSVITEVPKFTFVGDRGFYSEHNLNLLCGQGYKFTIPVPSHIPWQKKLIAEHRDTLVHPDNVLSDTNNNQ